MKVSVIITTYDRPGALRRVLDGLETQTRMPDEVIVADDGSGPDTSKAIHDYMANSRYPIGYIWQHDRGFRAARIRNKAILAAKGDYILLLDGDCVLSRHFIKDHVSLAQEGFFVQGKRVLVSKKVSSGFSSSEANSFFKLLRFFMSGGLSNSHHLIRMPILPASKSVRMGGIKSCNMGLFKRDLAAVNGFNEDFVGWGREDSELAVRLYRYGLRRKEHPFMAVCYHLWHEEHEKRNLPANDQLLERTMKSDEYFCPNGLVK